ncbi:aminopeptidase P family N-terminal domain-containing protein [Sporosarcina thermotolerans]|nr:aminopeptidase P family N-terminal domain-containing protein [Sporosarcina thermotolerans]WHT48190.1 aminopeptidase P family N-terminal domain-containing protein [Sporosarcina thermotolerans]
MSVSKLTDRLIGREWQGVIIYSPENRYYFSKYRGTAGMLVIQSGSQKLITDFRYVDQAKAQASDFDVLQHQQNMVELVCDQFSHLKRGVVGLEFGAVPVEIYLELKERLPQIEFVDCSEVTNAIRSIKDEEEIESIAKGIEICDQAFAHILTFIEPGKTEKEIGLELELFMKKAGAEGIKANHVIASGPRASLPHGQATDRVLEVGTFSKWIMGQSLTGTFRILPVQLYWDLQLKSN